MAIKKSEIYSELWKSCDELRRGMDAKKKQILLNLEMVKKPLHCLDYVFVHELVHMIERNHTDRFIELLESAYPKWKKSKQELNQGILSYSVWKC